MHMTIEYKPLGAGTAGPFYPKSINAKIQGPEGPGFASISWEKTDPIRVDDETYLITAEASVDGSSGYAAFYMQGSKLLSAASDGPVELRSIKFSQEPGTPGFTMSGLPRIMSGDPDPNAYVHDYFDEQGLFVDRVDAAGGMHAVWFDRDVKWEHIERFLKAHPYSHLGVFCSAVQVRPDKSMSWRLCYMYAHQEHADSDLSRWRSDDRGEARRTRA